ncbi:YopX family protein [Macrococcoides caseolyticum]|nr:YopX family protein [Macrococcus caseolyticus]
MWLKCAELMQRVHAINFYQETAEWIFHDLVNQKEVIEEELFENIILMQSTGLHDKNGKEIFEGDVVKYWENIGYIEFYQGSWVINWNDGSLFDLYDNENNLEIIGNIHEHPELLN